MTRVPPPSSSRAAARRSASIPRSAADARVAESLYHRAVGYAHKAEEIKVINGEVVRVRTTKRYPPDVTACIFWLKNRQRAKWRGRPDPEVPAVDFREMLRREVEAYRLFAGPAPAGPRSR